MFGSEAWVPATSLCVWKSISCLLSLIPKICLNFSCFSSVQHWESLGLFGLIVHSTARLPIYSAQTSLGLPSDLLGLDQHTKRYHLNTSYNLSDPFFIINNG